MKSRNPKSSYRGLALSALALAIAAPSLALSGAAFAADPIVIGVAMKTQLQRRWSFDAKAMQKEADKLGVKLVFQWANDDPSLQASQVENLLSQNPAALIMVPVDSQAAGKIAKSAKEQNVPVVAYDIGVSTAKVDFSVVRDNPKVGVLQAEGALKMAPGGTIAVFKGDPGNDVAQAIAKSYTKVLGGDKSIKIVFDQFIRNWDPKTALSNAENVLSAQDDKVNAFLVSNDGMASGISQAIKARNLAGKVYLSGLDADPANLRLVAEGLQTMTVWTDLNDEGASAVRAAAALAQGKLPDISTVQLDAGAGPVPTHLVEVTSVNKENLCDFITKKAPEGWTSLKEVFPDNPDACK